MRPYDINININKQVRVAGWLRSLSRRVKNFVDGDVSRLVNKGTRRCEPLQVRARKQQQALRDNNIEEEEA